MKVTNAQLLTALLNLFDANGCRAVTAGEIGGVMRLSPSTVLRRLRALQETSTPKGRLVVFSPRRRGMVTIVRLRPGHDLLHARRNDRLAELLKEIPE